MVNVNDLKIEKELMPLLDFTLNDFARNTLYNLLSNPLPTLASINQRQHILKAIALNWHVLKEYSYNKGDLPEVRQFLEKTIINEADISVSRVGYILHFQLDKRKKMRFRTSIVQCIRLFYRLQNRYFSILDTGLFPPDFKLKLENISSFLQIPNVAKYEQKIIEDALSTKDVINILILIKAKISAEDLSSFWQNLSLFEAMLSVAKAMQQYDFCFPEFHEDQALNLKDFYHPILSNPIKNNLDSAKGNIMLITGPNMSGKSTLLKSLSLCIYMAHLGFGVPAASCKIPFFSTISVVINQHDDIITGYSQFMSEIHSLKNVVKEAVERKSCFAVFDELFKGTNITDAIALSEATIKGLTKFRNSFFLISTHLHPLKDLLSEATIGAYYLDCSIENDLPIFTYKLQEGWSDLKLGQIIFEQEGLKDLLS